MKIQTITEHGIIMLVVFTMMGIGLSFAVHAEETNTTILEAIQEVVVDSGETPVTEEIVVGQAPITEEVTPITEEVTPITEEVTPITEEVVQPTIIISNYNSNDTLQSSSINPPTQVIADFIKSILG